MPTPSGTTILADSVVVVVQSAADQGETLLVQVSVTAQAAAVIDHAAVRELIAGKTVAEARDALEGLGEIDVDLWPGWVDKVPVLDFRIEIVEEVNEPTGGSPQESVN